MSNLFHAIITNVGADLRVCPENYCFTRKVEHHIKKEGEHTGSPLPNLCDLCGKIYELIGLKMQIT